MKYVSKILGIYPSSAFSVLFVSKVGGFIDSPLPPAAEVLNGWPLKTSPFLQNFKKLIKNDTKFEQHGNLYYHFAYFLARFLKLYLYICQRYGNPDVQILATLNIKIWIHRFLIMLMPYPRLILFFRVAKFFMTSKFCLKMVTLK